MLQIENKWGKKKTQNPNWDHHSNDSLVSHKFLISEMKMYSQESVHTYGHHMKERSVSKQSWGDPKHGFKEIRGIDNACDVQRLNQ